MTASAQARSADVACEPPASAVTPAPTRAGVFGMARTTQGWPPRAVSSRTLGMPATTDSTRRTPTAPRTLQAPSAPSGLTASTTPERSDGSRTRSFPGTSTIKTPGNSRSSSSRRAVDVSATATCAGVAHPEARSPPNRALPIFPPPTMSRSTVGGCAMGRRLPVREAGHRQGPWSVVGIGNHRRGRRRYILG